MRNRCRIVLGVTPELCSLEQVQHAVSGGDVASVISYCGSSDQAVFEQFCERLVPMVQAADAAAIIADDTQIAGRCEADGIHIERDRGQLADILARFSPQKIVGCGGMMDRHNALQIGELNPDFLLLGKLGKDIKPEPHAKNLGLGEWWAEFVEIPAIVPAGNVIDSVVDVARSGVDFVLIQSAVFGSDVMPGQAVKRANELLDEHAPDLLESDA